MKDLPLSLLSRGCGQFISSNKGKQDGRLDVCFTPQDYYIWRSRDSLLRLSKSGCLLTGEEPTLPKTYTTRRGPLILYSQDLVTLKTCGSEAVDGKQQVVRRYNPQGKQQLSTMKELTSTILNYNTHLLTASRLVPPLCPPYHHLPPPPVLRGPSPLSFHTIQQQLSPGMHVHVKPQWRNTEQQENPSEEILFPVDKEVNPDGRNRIRLNLFLQITTASRTPTPQMEPQPWIQHVATTSEEPEDTETHSNTSQQLSEHLQDTDIHHRSSAGELHHSDISDVLDDQCCFSQRDSETTGDKEGGHGRSISGCRAERIVCGSQQPSTTASETTTADVFLPPIRAPPLVCHRDSREQIGKVSRRSPSSDEQPTERLPPIAEKPTDGHKTQIQYDTKVQKTGFQSIKSTTVGVHQQPLHLPLLIPEKTEDMGQKQRRMREKTERQNCKQEAGGQKEGGGGGGGGGSLLPEKGFNIFLDPGEDPPVPVGVLGSVTGRRGPGRQSSMALLQNRLLDLQDGSEPSEASRGLVKGVLPLELRDLQNGKPVGSLIMGPDGEIIQLSLYDNIQNQPRGDGDTQEQALQVLSPEGEKLPWVILLQPQRTQTEVEGEQNTAHPVGVPPTSSVHRKDLRRSAETDPGSPKTHSDPVQGVEQPNSSQGVTMRKKWKNVKMDAENNNSVCSRSNEGMNVDPRRGDSKAKGEEEGHPIKGHLSESQKGDKVTHEGDVTMRRQRIISTEAITEDTVNEREKNMKRRDTHEAAAIREKRGMKGVTVNSAGKKAFRKRMEADQQTQKIKVNDAPPIRSQDQEDKENKEAVETQDSSAPPPMMKTFKSKDGQTGDVKMTENGDEGGEGAEQEKPSAGRGRRRSRRGRLKHKELVFGNPETLIEKEEVGINQQAQEFHPNRTSSPSAKQKHSQSTDVNSTQENRESSVSDAASNGDKHSRSVSSLRSAAAASCLLQSSSQRSVGSSCEGLLPPSSVGPSLSRSRLSSCSTVMITEEKLMLNPLKPEPIRNEEEEAAVLQKERRRQEVERRRKEMEEERRKEMEEERRQQEKEQMEEKMKNELEEERKRRAEEQRLKKQAEDEERKRREEDEQRQERRQQEKREREKRRQEERRRQMELFQRRREEEEQRRTAEQERLRLEEEKRQEEENQKLQGMEEGERIEYLRQKEQEEEDRRRKEEERQRRVEEEVLLAAEKARVEEELLTRQMALLQQKLSFNRGLLLEAAGLETTQGVSRPWTYSYFTLLQLLGLNPTKEHNT